MKDSRKAARQRLKEANQAEFKALILAANLTPLQRKILDLNNTQALINSQTQGFQAIQDKLCQLELDSYKQKVTDQAAEIVALKGAISQTAQTAALIQDNNNQTANLIRAINPAPIPAYQVPNPVTGCCGTQNYCGCGCG